METIAAEMESKIKRLKYDEQKLSAKRSRTRPTCKLRRNRSCSRRSRGRKRYRREKCITEIKMIGSKISAHLLVDETSNGGGVVGYL